MPPDKLRLALWKSLVTLSAYENQSGAVRAEKWQWNDADTIEVCFLPCDFGEIFVFYLERSYFCEHAREGL